MRPSSGRSKPAIRRSVVVLPEPDGPSSVKNSPAPIARSTPSTAATSPYDLRTPTSSTAGAAGVASTDRASEVRAWTDTSDDYLVFGLRRARSQSERALTSRHRRLPLSLVGIRRRARLRLPFTTAELQPATSALPRLVPPLHLRAAAQAAFHRRRLHGSDSSGGS